MEQLQTWYEQKESIFNFDEIRQLAVAGGADDSFITSQIEKLKANFKNIIESIRNKTFHSGGGRLTYITWGWKPTNISNLI